MLFVPFVLATGGAGKQLRSFSTLATFGAALDITIAELAIESFFPADRATAAALRARGRSRAWRPRRRVRATRLRQGGLAYG